MQQVKHDPSLITYYLLLQNQNQSTFSANPNWLLNPPLPTKQLTVERQERN